MEGPDIVAGTGTDSVAGAAAITEAGDVVAGAGADTFGAAAITEADDVVAGVGVSLVPSLGWVQISVAAPITAPLEVQSAS
jgi:hypothetical protein